MATRILVCGATGFIGRNLIERLALNSGDVLIAHAHKKDAIDFKDIEWRYADLRNEAQVAQLLKGIDIVIHAAATTSGAKDIVQHPSIHVTDNAVMNSYLLRAAAEANVKHFIFFSCSIMYPGSEIPIKENSLDLNQKIDEKYFGAAWTKLYIEKMCEFYSQRSKTRFTVIRHTNVYGEHDKFDLERSHVFGATITKVLTNKTGTITVWGNGSEKRDFLYVGDLIELVRDVIDKQTTNFEIFNAASGTYLSVKELVQKIICASGRQLKMEFDESKPSIKSSPRLDSEKVATQLGWKARTNIDDGISITIDWWLKNIGRRDISNNQVKKDEQYRVT